MSADAVVGASPALWLGLTVAAYAGGLWLQARAGRSPLVNPVLVGIVAVVAVLAATGVEYDAYFTAAMPLHLVLGPAVVALAVPLYRQLAGLREALSAVLVAVVVGGAVASASAFGIAALLGASDTMALSIAPRSVTAPVGMEIAAKIGGIPALTALAAVAGGILGAVLGDRVLDLVGVRDPRARGLAVGSAAHAIGTARQLEQSEVSGAYGGLALGLHALIGALVLPLVLGWLAGR